MGGLYLNKTDTPAQQHGGSERLSATSIVSPYIVPLMIDPLSCTSEGQRSHLAMALNAQDISKRIYAEINVWVLPIKPTRGIMWPPPSRDNSAVHQNTRAVQHLQSNHLKPAPSSALTSIWTWLAEALLVCVCACGNKWVYSSSIYLVKQPILLPKLVRDYLFVTLATPSSCFTFSALGALLREGEKAVIDRATVAKWKHGHWRTTRNKDLLSWTSQVHLGYRCVGLFW